MSKYFKLKDAIKEIRNSDGVLNKTFSVGKLLGKTISNTVVYTATEALR